MHLLLGDPQAPFCLRVRAVLESRNFATHVMANPLVHPSRFAWRLDNGQSATRLAWDGGPSIRNEDISGVLVTGTAWIDPAGWQPDDLAYVYAETQAALLAWLWSLDCPVVNRFAAAIWHRPKIPPGQENMAGVVYGPLTSDIRYLVSSDQDWNGMAALQRYAPVCLAHPHGAVQLVCVVGEQVVWEGEPPPEMTPLEPALRRFAAAAGLTFVEMAFAPASDGHICVVAVEPHPNFERFGDIAQEQIVEGIVRSITEAPRARKGSVQSRQSSFA